MPKHSPVLFDAADTSSFTLSGQRENIEGVEVGGTGLTCVLSVEKYHRLKSVPLERLSAGETRFDVMPPFDLITFVCLPTQKHDAPIAH